MLAFEQKLLGPLSSFRARLVEQPLAAAKRASHHLGGTCRTEPASLSLPRAVNRSLLAFQAERRFEDRLEMSTPRSICANYCLHADLRAWHPAPALSAQPSQGLRAGLQEDHTRESMGILTWGQGPGGIHSRAVRVMINCRTRGNSQKTLDGVSTQRLPILMTMTHK